MGVQKPRKLPRDINSRAAAIVALSTRQAVEEATAPAGNKNPAAVALGKLGGLKGGKARAKALTPKKRSEIARLAAAARWKKK